MKKRFTEVDLQRALIDLIRAELEDTVVEIETKNGVEKHPITVYKQHIPYAMSDEEEAELYPGVIVRLLDSDRTNFQSVRLQRVGVYIAIRSEVLDPSIPHEWLWVIAHKIQFLFEAKRVIENFVLQKPPRVIEPEEIVYPVYAIGMELTFEVPVVSVPVGSEFERMI